MEYHLPLLQTVYQGESGRRSNRILDTLSGSGFSSQRRFIAFMLLVWLSSSVIFASHASNEIGALADGCAAVVARGIIEGATWGRLCVVQGAAMTVYHACLDNITFWADVGGCKS